MRKFFLIILLIFLGRKIVVISVLNIYDRWSVTGKGVTSPSRLLSRVRVRRGCTEGVQVGRRWAELPNVP